MSETPKEPAKNPSEPKTESKSELKAQLKTLMDKLNHQENQKFPGAPHRSGKARMLDASALEQKDPDHHYRYENTDDVGKMQVQMDDGYEAVPEKECEDAGVRAQVGELRLIRIPREQHEAEVERQREVAKSRLTAHRQEMRGAAEAIVKELRDKHGYNIPVERFLVDE